MSRQALSQFTNQRVYVRGRVQRHGQSIGNNEPTICLEMVTIDADNAPLPLLFDHIWLRRGVTPEIQARMTEGEWFSLTAKVWKYRHLDRDDEAYGLAFPEDVFKSYSDTK